MFVVLMPKIDINMRLGRGLNDREHYLARTKRVRKEKQTIGWMLTTIKRRPVPPCTITLTRIAPSAGLDDDNLAGSLKSVRDAVAEWIGVDDRHADVVRYLCKQERGSWCVRVEWE